MTNQEIGLLGQALRGLGAAGGGAVGGYFGNPMMGSAVGGSLGATISRWLGAGDYSVTGNTMVNRVARGSDAIPAMHSTGQTVVVRHKEYLGEIRSSATFALANSLPLNPGMPGTFPWLSDIAVRFQEYRLKGMVFHYVPTSGSSVSGSNPAIGSVMIQTSYRPTDIAPTSKLEMMNEYFSSEASPAESFCHPIECDPRENPFSTMYVRSGPIPAGDSLLMYDLGTTHVAVTGNPATGNVLGDLWVTYEVELKKPVLSSNSAAQIQGAFLPVNLGIGFTPIPTNWFGGQSSNIGNIVVTTDSANLITLPRGCAGSYLLQVVARAATSFTVLNMGTNPVLTNCAAIGVVPGSGTVFERTVLGGTTPTVNNGFYYTNVYVPDPMLTATIRFPNDGAWTGSISSFYLVVTQLETRTT